MYKINNKLAVHGFDWNWKTMEAITKHDHEYDEYNYGVITDQKYDLSGSYLDDWIILDCRILLDDRQSPLDYYGKLIGMGEMFLKEKKKVVCCCSAGQSRSSSIALGLLVRYFGFDFYDAWEEVKEKNPVCNIAPQHISSLKELFGITLP